MFYSDQATKTVELVCSKQNDFYVCLDGNIDVFSVHRYQHCIMVGILTQQMLLQSTFVATLQLFVLLTWFGGHK